MQRTRRRSVNAFITLASFGIVGCHGYSARPIPAPSLTKQFVGSTVRVTRTNGVRIDLEDAYVQGDSITGITVPHPAHRVAVAIRDIADVQSSEFQMGRTIRNSLGIFAGIVLLVMILMSG